MKRIIITLAFAFVTLFASAQINNQPAGIRMEIGEIRDNDDVCVAFSYKDEDGTIGYYLSVGYQFDILEIFSENTSSSFGHLDETCLVLGSTLEEALATVDSMLELYDKDPGTVIELPAREAVALERLGDETTATCMVVKRFLQAKRLCFHFTRGTLTAQVDLPKSSLRSIRGMIEFDLRRQRRK